MPVSAAVRRRVRGPAGRSHRRARSKLSILVATPRAEDPSNEDDNRLSRRVEAHLRRMLHHKCLFVFDRARAQCSSSRAMTGFPARSACLAFLNEFGVPPTSKTPCKTPSGAARTSRSSNWRRFSLLLKNNACVTFLCGTSRTVSSFPLFMYAIGNCVTTSGAAVSITLFVSFSRPAALRLL